MFYTFGHSNLKLEEIKQIADFYSLDIIVDIRRFPTSKLPWLKRESFEDFFGERYLWLGDKLGGYREGGYENYMKSEEFKEGIEELISLEGDRRVGIMCSEKLWLRGHRRYVAAHLSSLGYPVSHIADFRDNLDRNFKQSMLNESFFMRDAKDVAVDLLGKIVVRKIGRRYLLGKIVETEAYYGEKDPASRAYKGKKNYNRGMWLPGGHIFIYMVHANWMFNITTDGNEAEAILIRALEPLTGIDVMVKNRGRKKIRELCSGPGKWTRAFEINPLFNEQPLGKDLYVVDSPWHGFEMGMSKRIGVKRDMDCDLRFYIKGNRFVSR